MKKRHNTFKILLSVMVMVFMLEGCSLWNRYFGSDEEKNANELMVEGVDDMGKGRYESAAEAFQNIRDRYPYSQYAVTAELKMADALFEKGDYDQAYDAYDEFEKLHPKNKDIPYVMYQKGMCNFLQMRTVDREQSHTLKAKEAFEQLIRKYPRTEYAAKAQKNLRKCIIYLAEHELQVGHFYFKMGFYRAALARYQYIIRNYPDLGQYHEAMEYISKCKEKMIGDEIQG